MSRALRVAYDVELMRPACVLIAAAMGADTAPCHAFDASDWLVELTPGMAVYETTPDQLLELVAVTARSRALRSL